ncbi:MAG: hypothetical protein M3O34_05125 [Chloroflexota bacterium]|nr:hypothetical protein [Chloroflexota bacterium]
MLGTRKGQLTEPTKREWRSPWRGIVSGAAALTLAATLALPAATPPAYADHLDSDAATVDEILDDPMAFYSERVTVSGEVGERLGALAFTVEDGDLLFGEHLLVIGAPIPDGPPTGAVSPEDGCRCTWRPGTIVSHGGTLAGLIDRAHHTVGR